VGRIERTFAASAESVFDAWTSPEVMRRWFHYDAMTRPFLAWTVEEGIRRFEELRVGRLRHYRALVATRQTRLGRPLEGRSVRRACRGSPACPPVSAA
jgi:hypothetical protein